MTLFQTYLILACGIYLIIQTFLVRTHGSAFTVMFKAIPTFLGITCLFVYLKQTGVL